ncbi:MAG: class I SAM-dependent methyltransferase [Chloroflexota bacterium]
MPFRAEFDCLWCGRHHVCRGTDDIEGWAGLCPDCLGRAGDNGFLRSRLRAALDERGAATVPPADPDDIYLGRGRFARTPIDEAAWNAELDAAGRWLDRVPLSGQIVELAAGAGWWSPLLASKGELWVYDADAGRLDRARDRLVAHGLRAHLHVRDPWAEPDRRVDAVFTALWLGGVASERLATALELVHRWLTPGGRLAFIDSLGDPPAATNRAVLAGHPISQLDAALEAAGFEDREIASTGRFLVTASAIA